MRECQHCKNCFTDEIKACLIDGMPMMPTISGEPVLERKYHLESRVGQGGMRELFQESYVN